MKNPFGIFKKHKVALVLGGGSARGIAHIGVLKVLQAEKIPVDLVVGTSIGAFVGAFFALDEPLEKAERLALEFKTKDALDFMIPPRMGIIKGERIAKLIDDLIGQRTFGDLKIPMAIVTTDIENREEVVFTEGPLAELIMMSCTYPGIIVPHRMDGRLLVDGGIMNSVPVSVARRLGADFIIAVDVGFCVKKGRIRSIFEIILQVYQIMGDELNKHQARDADMIIRPDLGDIDQLGFEHAKIAIEKGEIAALEKLPQIKKRLGL